MESNLFGIPLNIPNILTLLRIAMIPMFVIVFYLPFGWSHKISALIFALAAITDYLDGYFARHLNQSSPFGEFLDPVADKLMVAVALILLVSEPHMPFLALPAAIIVGREIVISALREWMSEIGKRTHVAVSWLGKVKTTSQMIALILLLAYQPGVDTTLGILGYLLIYLSAILTLTTMILYLRAAWSSLTLQSKQE